VIHLRHERPSLWHAGLAKDIEDLWEPWMREADRLLEGLCPPARPALRMPLPLRFIHALHQSGPFHDPALSCQFHQPLVQIPDHFGTDHLSQPRQGLCIRHFLIADSREGPIDQIRAHFPLQRVVTPVPHMLQDQQRHFGGCLAMQRA